MSRKVPCRWNDTDYDSLKAAAEAQGVSSPTMLYRLRCGYTCDSDLLNRRRPTRWNGTKHKTITAAANANFVTYSGMQYRLRQGYTCDADLLR